MGEKIDPRERLLSAFPRTNNELVVRSWSLADVHARALWPSYPKPYEAFNSQLSNMDAAQRREYFTIRNEAVNRVTLSVDHSTCDNVGYIGMRQICWKTGVIGNMGIRVHPKWCNQGVGSAMLCTVCQVCADVGMSSMKLDVAQDNARAVACYEKTGFHRTGQSHSGSPAFVWMEKVLTPTHTTNRISRGEH